jgi:hypothetical protein
VTSFVVGVWVATIAWLFAGYFVFHFAIQRSLRDRGVPRPSGLRAPIFLTNQSRELQTYRTRRLRAGQGIVWWRVMIAWQVLFGLLAMTSLVTTVLASL